jgi:hypothetical protein
LAGTPADILQTASSTVKTDFQRDLKVADLPVIDVRAGSCHLEHRKCLIV